MNKVTKTTNAIAGSTIYVYSKFGDLLSETDTLGNTKTYTYRVTEAHEFVWVTDKEATASEQGMKHEECTVCGFRRSENTPIPEKQGKTKVIIICAACALLVAAACIALHRAAQGYSVAAARKRRGCELFCRCKMGAGGAPGAFRRSKRRGVELSPLCVGQKEHRSDAAGMKAYEGGIRRCLCVPVPYAGARRGCKANRPLRQELPDGGGFGGE